MGEGQGVGVLARARVLLRVRAFGLWPWRAGCGGAVEWLRSLRVLGHGCRRWPAVGLPCLWPALCCCLLRVRACVSRWPAVCRWRWPAVGLACWPAAAVPVCRCRPRRCARMSGEPVPVCRWRWPAVCRWHLAQSAALPIFAACRRRGYLPRPVWCLDSLVIYAPYNPPFCAFSTKNRHGILCKNNSQVPFRGTVGTVLGVLTAQKIAAIIRAKRRPHGQRPANRRQRRPERGGEHDHAHRKRIACTTGARGRTAPAPCTRQRVQRP